jgi:hypothetical protein
VVKVWQIAAAALAVACAAACTPNRPLPGPRRDGGRADARDAMTDGAGFETPSPDVNNGAPDGAVSSPDAPADLLSVPDAPVEAADDGVPQCSRPGDVCCIAPGLGVGGCQGGLSCDQVTRKCVACGNDGQPCCAEQRCNVGLGCDQPSPTSPGTCSARCGRKDGSCCRGGGCETGTLCYGNDETGVCRACGLPGLLCCRADCWIGVCDYGGMPRMCLPCGLAGQACCGDEYSFNRCQDGTTCQRAPGEDLSTCR